MRGIAERIKQIRTEANLSQKEFGKRIGVGDSYISEIESGKKRPSPPLLLAIEYRFKVGVNWITTGKGAKDRTEEVQLTSEEREIIKALREQKELKKFILLLIEKFHKREGVVRKLGDFLKTF